MPEISNLITRNPELFKAIMLTSGGLTGGLSSTIAGGKFIDGLKQGLITSGLDHLAHSGIEYAGNQKIRDINIEVTDEIVGSTVLKGYPYGDDQLYETPLYKMTISGTDQNGNAISHDYKVTRFGIKVGSNGVEKIQTLAAGKYTLKDFHSNVNIPLGVFRISGPYLLHLGNINTPMGNNGCIAVYGGRVAWQSFLNDIASMSGSNNYNAVASGGHINMNINYAPTPKISRVK
ncbi:hypothetical protein [Epilithonimonas hominis]|nr:hypothetical protein [Epilithonimonas hominis]